MYYSISIELLTPEEEIVSSVLVLEFFFPNISKFNLVSDVVDSLDPLLLEDFVEFLLDDLVDPALFLFPNKFRPPIEVRSSFVSELSLSSLSFANTSLKLPPPNIMFDFFVFFLPKLSPNEKSLVPSLEPTELSDDLLEGGPFGRVVKSDILMELLQSFSISLKEGKVNNFFLYLFGGLEILAPKLKSYL